MAEILLVDDDPKTLLALQAVLGNLGQSLVAVASGRAALLKLLEQEFALILLDVQMPDLDGFATAELIRNRDKTRYTPIIFLTAHAQDEHALLRGYALGAVDFLFKPIVPEILRSKVAVFVELHRRTQQVRQQGQLSAAESARWETDDLRKLMAEERQAADIMVRKAAEVARALAERDAVAHALVQSNARLSLLSDTANRLLMGQRPHALLSDLFERLTGHLDLDLYAYRALDHDGKTVTLQAYGGIDEASLPQYRTTRIGEGLAGIVAAQRARIIVDEVNLHPEDAPPGVHQLGMTACVCFPLVADDRLIGTLSFGTRRRRCFSLDELEVMQMVADQIAIAVDRERLMTELTQRNATLADADRRKDEFLAMLAHELRNPLAPIVNALHVVGKEAAHHGESVARAHQTIDRQVRHLIRLIDDLLDVSRITQGKIVLRRERTSLQAVIEQAVQIARPLIHARQHTLVVDVPKEPLPVEVDVTRMTQVVSNLLNNAAKYTNRSGTITLTVTPAAKQVVLRVKDDGIGIRAEMLPRVFELFMQADHTSDRAAGGLGIGLTLVKRLVQMHGGEVTAKSEGPGKGSEFAVSLPLDLADSRQLTANSRNDPEVPNCQLSAVGRQQGGPLQRPLRILVVEDNPDIRETLKDSLEFEGYEVTVAEDGPAAVEKVGDGHEHDVALVDIGLPGLDGYAVGKRLSDIRRQKGFPRRLIAMTGYGRAEDRSRALAAGFDEHLVKPVHPDTLTRLLAAQFNEGGA